MKTDKFVLHIFCILWCSGCFNEFCDVQFRECEDSDTFSEVGESIRCKTHIVLTGESTQQLSVTILSTKVLKALQNEIYLISYSI